MAFVPSFVPNQRSQGGYGRQSNRMRSGGSRGGGFGGGRRQKAMKNNFGIRTDQIGGKLQSIDWAREQLPPFNRECWSGQPTPPDENATLQWRQSQEVIVQGEGIPPPILSFHNTNLPSGMVNKFSQLGFTTPTPIQAQGWPMALTGRDVVGIAETGSGKTLAFILPGIIHIQGQPRDYARQRNPIALVVAPTRELAIQIETETKKFAYSMGVTVSCVYGGAPRRQQEKQLRGGCQFLIATPGRLLDFVERRTFSLKTVSYCVFDEADRMLDMGFEPQIRALMSQIRPDRQMLMWSATWPREVRKLADDFLSPRRCFLKCGDENKAAETVTQKIMVIGRHQKGQRIVDILNEQRGEKALVFCGTKRMCDQLSRDLYSKGFEAAAIHGDKEQWQREQSLNDFKMGKVKVLVATDVASRGIDVKDLTLVLNYDFPQNCEDYIHRVGRTGRAGKKGTAITFFDARNDAKHARKLIAILQKNNQEVPPELLQHGSSRGHGGSRFQSRGGSRNYGGRSGGRSSYRPY